MVPNQRKRLHDNAATPWGKAHISCETLTCGPPLWPAPEYAYGRRFLVPCCTARPYTGPLYGGAPRSSACARGRRRPDDGEIPSLLAVAVALSYVRTSTSARHIAWQGAPAAGFQLANVALDPSQESEVITVLNKCSNTTVHQREPAPTSGSQPNEYIAFSSCGLLASYFSLRTHQHKQSATSQTN